MTDIASRREGIYVPAEAPAGVYYFVDGNGKAVILTGSHTWNDFQDWSANGTTHPFDFSGYVSMLSSTHQNFTLLWNTELPNFCNLPTGATTIAGAGKWLVPGLVDMHVHFNEARDGALYVATGIPTVRNMWGGPPQLAWRAKAKVNFKS